MRLNSSAAIIKPFKKKQKKKKPTHTWRGTGRVGEVLKVAGIQLLVLHAVSLLSIFHHPHSVYLPLSAAPPLPGPGPALVFLPEPGARPGPVAVPEAAWEEALGQVGEVAL